MTVSDRAGRRSNAAQDRRRRPAQVRAAGRCCPAGPLPAAFTGQRHVDLGAARSRGRRRRRDRRPRPRRRHLDRLRQELRRRSSRWAQFNPGARRARCTRRACASARGSSSTATTPRARRASAPTRSPTAPTASSSTPSPSTRASTPPAQQYVAALRADGRRRTIPIGLTSFPYVDYHPRLPVLGLPRPRRRAGEPPAGLLEGHRRHRRRGLRAHARGTTASTARRSPRSARPTATPPAGGHRSASARCGRPTARAACRGGPGRRPARPSGASLGQPLPARRPPPPDPGWPTLGQGQQGRPGRVAAAAPRVLRPGGDGRRPLRRGTDTALRNFQTRARPPADRRDRRRDVAGRPGAPDGREGLDAP